MNKSCDIESEQLVQLGSFKIKPNCRLHQFPEMYEGCFDNNNSTIIISRKDQILFEAVLASTKALLKVSAIDFSAHSILFYRAVNFSTAKPLSLFMKSRIAVIDLQSFVEHMIQVYVSVEENRMSHANVNWCVEFIFVNNDLSIGILPDSMTQSMQKRSPVDFYNLLQTILRCVDCENKADFCYETREREYKTVNQTLQLFLDYLKDNESFEDIIRLGKYIFDPYQQYSLTSSIVDVTKLIILDSNGIAHTDSYKVKKDLSRSRFITATMNNKLATFYGIHSKSPMNNFYSLCKEARNTGAHLGSRDSVEKTLDVIGAEDCSREEALCKMMEHIEKQAPGFQANLYKIVKGRKMHKKNPINAILNKNTNV